MPFGGLLTAGAVSAGTSLISGLLGKSAAEKAADIQAKAAAQGIQSLTDSEKQVLSEFQATQGKVEGEYAPYQASGTQANSELSTALAPGGDLTKSYSPFAAPTGVDEQNDPGYQFRIQQGLKALSNAQSRNGDLLGSAGIKATNDYAQGAASNEYQNVYNRALNTYGTNFNTFNTGQNNLYSRLYGLSGQGLSATNGLAGAQTGITNAEASTQNSTAGSIANLITGQGAAQAAGVVGGTNALTGAFGNIGGTAQQLSLVNLLFKPKTGGGGGTTPPVFDPTDESGG